MPRSDAWCCCACTATGCSWCLPRRWVRGRRGWRSPPTAARWRCRAWPSATWRCSPSVRISRCATPVSAYRGRAGERRCARRSGRCADSLHFRVGGRGQEQVLDALDQRTVALGLRTFGEPFGVGHEGTPLALALAHAVPFQQVVQALVVRAHQHGPETRLADAVFFPQRQCGGLETLVEI